MVELTTKITASGVLYVPKEIRECFGRHMRIIPDAKAALFFPVGVSYENVLRSLETIMSDVKHRIAMSKESSCKPEVNHVEVPD